jgi:hypothetical protein
VFDALLWDSHRTGRDLLRTVAKVTRLQRSSPLWAPTRTRSVQQPEAIRIARSVGTVCHSGQNIDSIWYSEEAFRRTTACARDAVSSIAVWSRVVQAVGTFCHLRLQVESV